MKAFARLLDEIGYAGFAVIEQDMYPAPFDKPLPIAKRTREYLRELGIG
jgi:inosose dehydratase